MTGLFLAATTVTTKTSFHMTFGWVWLILLVVVSVVMIWAVKVTQHWAWLLALIFGFMTYAVFAARISPWLSHVTAGHLG